MFKKILSLNDILIYISTSSPILLILTPLHKGCLEEIDHLEIKPHILDLNSEYCFKYSVLFTWYSIRTILLRILFF